MRLHQAQPLLEAVDGTPEAALGQELFRRAAAGVGGEVHLDWPEGGAWVEHHLQVTGWGVGGTGAQAAQTLALLGAPALISLQDRSARQLAVIHPDVQVATPAGVRACGGLAPVPGGKPAHYIFEFTAGVRVGTFTPKRSSRTIVRFADERLDEDPDFARESTAAAGRASAGILSGFNEIAGRELEAALVTSLRLARVWRGGGLPMLHLELGDFPTVPARDRVLRACAGIITSLGMSFSELQSLCATAQRPIDKALELSQELDLTRLCVHADAWALTLTRGDPEREFDALLCGCLLAASRAAQGQICRPTGIPSQGVFHEPPCHPFGTRGDRSVVCCAVPHLEQPAATIGLGDTFLAGTLLLAGSRGAP